MATRNRIPALLEPYLQLPRELPLILLTGTLGCSPTWLSSLFVASALSLNLKEMPLSGGGHENAVIFASWMRDAEFWRSHIKRTTSLDIAKLEQQGRFVFIDRLSSPQPTAGATDILTHTERLINQGIAKARSYDNHRTPILVLDNPDLLLATECSTAAQLQQFILRLRSTVNSTILSCSADLPLVSAASQSGGTDALPMDYETAAFVSQLSHCAHLVMSVRELQTGAAKDVSGVLRVTRAAGVYVADALAEEDVRELETLYFVQRDGTVKVFARGQVG